MPLKKAKVGQTVYIAFANGAYVLNRSIQTLTDQGFTTSDQSADGHLFFWERTHHGELLGSLHGGATMGVACETFKEAEEWRLANQSK